MKLLAFLLSSANAPFSISVAVALLFFAIQASGLLSLFSGGDDADGDADADGEADGEADGDADGHDHEHDGDHDGDDGGLLERLLGPLGVGTIPLSFIWTGYAMIFGVCGIVLNAGMVGQEIPTGRLLWTVPLSVVAAYAIMAVVARLIRPIFATEAQEATTTRQLTGQSGTVISSRVNQEFGEIRIQDRSGHLLRLPCRMEPGYPGVPEGGTVVVVGQQGAWLRVVPLEIGPESVSGRTSVKNVRKDTEQR